MSLSQLNKLNDTPNATDIFFSIVPKRIEPLTLIQDLMTQIFVVSFVYRPGQQSFSHVWTEPPLPGYLPVLSGA